MTISVPIVWSNVSRLSHSHPKTSDEGETHILGASRLQINSPIKQLFQQWEYPLPLQAALQTSQKLQVQLHLAPFALGDLLLDQFRQLREQHIDDLRAGRVRDDHDGGDEGRLERLLNGQLESEVDKVTAQQLVIPVVCEEGRNGVDFFVPRPHGILGDGDELLAHAHVGRREIVVAATRGGATLVLIVVCD